jgi:hypothetical protein
MVAAAVACEFRTLVATLIGRDVYAQPISAVGQAFQTVEIILGPLLLGLMALAIRRVFQR